MLLFRAYYADRVVEGETREDWLRLPDGLQVVTVFGPHPDNVAEARSRDGYVFCGSRWPLYTGVDSYDPLNSGTRKKGLLLPDDQYRLIWERARGDS